MVLGPISTIALGIQALLGRLHPQPQPRPRLHDGSQLARRLALCTVPLARLQGGGRRRWAAIHGCSQTGILSNRFYGIPWLGCRFWAPDLKRTSYRCCLPKRGYLSHTQTCSCEPLSWGRLRQDRGIPRGSKLERCRRHQGFVLTAGSRCHGGSSVAICVLVGLLVIMNMIASRTFVIR